MDAATPLLIAGPLEIFRVVSQPFAENSYIVRRDGQPGCLVIDPGFEPDLIVSLLEQLRLEPEAVWLTHGHSDHIAGVAPLRQLWPRLPILIGHADAEKLTNPVANLSAGYGISVTSPPADTLLKHGERVGFGGLEASVVEIPGHSQGHLAFLFPTEPILVFGGDILFHESIGRTDFPGGDHNLLVQGVTRKIFPLGDELRVYPGHGPNSTIGKERTTNPFFR